MEQRAGLQKVVAELEERLKVREEECKRLEEDVSEGRAVMRGFEAKCMDMKERIDRKDKLF